MAEFVHSNPHDYALLIQFKSNERPFNWRHSAYKIYDDAEAIEWAQAMAFGMGNNYNVTLVKGSAILEYRENIDAKAELEMLRAELQSWGRLRNGKDGTHWQGKLISQLDKLELLAAIDALKI